MSIRRGGFQTRPVFFKMRIAVNGVGLGDIYGNVRVKLPNNFGKLWRCVRVVVA